MRIITEFSEWFWKDFILKFKSPLCDILVALVLAEIATATTYIWIGPFIYWYFKEWRGKKNGEKR